MIRAALLAAAVCTAPLAAAPALAQDGHVNHASHADDGHTHDAFASDRIQVIIEGQGPDVVFIPGLSSSPAVWQGTVDHLNGAYRVHRIHVNGFAGAPAGANATGSVAAPVAEEIARYIREQGLKKPAVVGHSMGGTMGLMLAARHPDLVGKLMVVDMIPFMGAMFGPPGTTAESVIPIADQVYAAQSTSARDQYLTQARAAVTGMIATEAARTGPLSDVETSDQQVSASAFRELIVTDLRPELSKITAPTEVLYVKFNDPRMTDAITDAIYQMSFATLSGAKLKRIDDSAHFIMLDQPQTFYGDLDAFLSAK